eukprot:gene19629-25540_t
MSNILKKRYRVDLLWDRTLGMFLAAPKMFLGSFFWEGFAMLASNSLNLSDLSFWFCLLTGIGTAIGIIVGHLGVVFLTTTKKVDIDIELHAVALLAVALGLFTGTLWQVSVNISKHLHLDFTQAFWFVGAVSTGYSFVSLTVCRYLNTIFPEIFRLQIKPVRETWYLDLLLSISVGAADAFFVGTSDISVFANDWLPGFAVRDNTSVFVAMLLAGSSSLCGFLVCQSIQNIILIDTWLDVTGDDGNIDTLDRLDAYNVTVRDHHIKSNHEETILLNSSVSSSQTQNKV